MAEDKTLTCRECARDFTFTASEQDFHAQKGFTNEPGRCPECRALRKAANNGSTGWSSGSGYDRSPRQMYPTVCSQCGKNTEVPFQPTNGKPVYCSDCFRSVAPRSSYGSRR